MKSELHSNNNNVKVPRLQINQVFQFLTFDSFKYFLTILILSDYFICYIKQKYTYAFFHT